MWSLAAGEEVTGLHTSYCKLSTTTYTFHTENCTLHTGNCTEYIGNCTPQMHKEFLTPYKTYFTLHISTP